MYGPNLFFSQLEYDHKGVPVSGIERFMHAYIYVHAHSWCT